jgi:maleate isomerase
MESHEDTDDHGFLTLTGRLSGKTIRIPDVNAPPIPYIVAPGVIHDGDPAPGFGSISSASHGCPDTLSFRRRFGLLVPATNTIMEHELWGMIFANQGPDALRGIGIHTTTVSIPRPQVGTAEGLENFKEQFLGGLESAVTKALLASPQYLIMGISLEHILTGIGSIRETMAKTETYCPLGWSTEHEAIKSALDCYGAQRIGLLTPWERIGNGSATRMFEDLGCEVVSSVGFSCGNVQHIAHIPDWAKEKAITELLATAGNRLDAIVQCGTNMSMNSVLERLEPVVGIPIIGVNAAILWYALRENGFQGPLKGGGRLLREF